MSIRQSPRQRYRKNVTRQRRLGLLSVFLFLFFLIFLRLFLLQIVRGSYYDGIVRSSREIDTSINAVRGHIYVTDRGGQSMQLTENITVYTLFVEPPWIWDKQRVIKTLAPHLYRHLCEQYGTLKPDQAQCVTNLQVFTREPLLPEEPEVYYRGQGVYSSGYDAIDRTGYTLAYDTALESMNSEVALGLITKRLDTIIKSGNRERNYVGIFSEDSQQSFLEEVRQRNHPAIQVYDDYYIYINPSLVGTLEKNGLIRRFQQLLDRYEIESINAAPSFEFQKYKYIELAKNVHPSIISDIKKIKSDLRGVKGGADNAPLLHGVGFSPVYERYYPHGSFMSHLLGYTTLQGGANYGIEEYFDAELRGQAGKISGLQNSFGIAGSSSFEINEAANGKNIHLTIDPVMQYTIEEIAMRRHRQFRTDSVSVLVLDPYNGQIKASVNAPTFNPNLFAEYYRLTPVKPGEEELLDNETYLDIPLFVKTGGNLIQLGNRDIRNTPDTIKLRYENEPLGPLLFKDKNITLPYEPGSVFKTITYAIGIDVDEIEETDEYTDTEGKVFVEPFYIRNADKSCHTSLLPRTYLFALEYSCNVGMVRIAQEISKPMFYNYLEKLEFGNQTHVELAGEEEGFVNNQTIISKVGFFNNTFGQGLTVTPLQMAAAYAATINGGYYVKPTILDKICDESQQNCFVNSKKVLHQVFKPETSKDVIVALQSVLTQNESLRDDAGLPGYDVGGKSGTSQIAQNGRYRGGEGWTNGSFVGVVSGDHPQYVVVVQVRRPRSVQWGGETAGPIFKEVAEFLVGYELMEQ